MAKKIIYFLHLFSGLFYLCASSFCSSNYELNNFSEVSVDEFTIVAAGDLVHAKDIFHVEVEALGKLMYYPTREVIQSADLAFVNLESPFTTHPPTKNKKAKFLFTMYPDDLNDILWAGFNVLNLANNHADDAGSEGIRDTIELLEKARKEKKIFLKWMGTKKSLTEEFKPLIFTIPHKNIKIAFLAYANNVFPLVNTFKLNKAIDDIKSIYNVDFIVVSLHYGIEFDHVPTPNLISAYRKLIDSGANLILAHHPHVPQGIEYYKGGLIFYSLGDYSMSNKPKPEYTKKAKFYGLIPRLTFKRREIVSPFSSSKFNLTKAEIIPLYVDNVMPMIVGNQILRVQAHTPFIPPNPFADIILQSIVDWSNKISGNTTKFQIVDERLFINLATPRQISIK